MSTELIFDPKNPKSVSRTQQQFKKEADINTIMHRFAKTGVLGDPLRQNKPYFGDISDIGDFQQMQEKVMQAKETFAQLPAVLRRRFNDDPQKVVEFISNPANNKECMELGLTKPVETIINPPQDETKVNK